MVKLKDVLHLYIGQEVVYGFKDREKKGRLVGKQEPFGWQVFDPSLVMANYRTVRDDLIKPILRHLSDMTEEEAGEVYRIGYESSPPVGDFEYDVNKNLHEGKVVSMDIRRLDNPDFFLNVSCHDGACEVFRDDCNHRRWSHRPHNAGRLLLYLLSRGFDLFGLIESGEAISLDETKL